MDPFSLDWKIPKDNSASVPEREKAWFFPNEIESYDLFLG